MANTSLRIGGGKWAVKEDSLLGYNVIQNKYVPIEMDTVRATTATRVNENGLIEVTPYNLFTYSEQFDNASWVKERITITTNATTAPNGTLTADKIVEDTTTNSHRVRQNATSEQGIQYTLSYYLKASERTKARINVGGLNAFAYFDLSNGTIMGTPTFCTALIIDANNGWYRCSITYTQTSATSTAQLHLAAPLKEPAAFNYLGDGVSGIFVWGAQLVTGASAKEYFPTTDRLNIPRIDYTSGQGAILVEPQRTNLLLRSEEFDNASWTKVRATIIANTTNAPDGSLTSDSITCTDTSTNGAFIRQVTSLTNERTTSIFVKPNTAQYFQIHRDFGSGVVFNLTNGTIKQSLGATGTIVDYGNGWYRCSATFSVSGLSLFIVGNSSMTVTSFNTTINESLYIYGAQLEAGSYPTSYIPTVASTVTRNADVISKTGISSLIGQTEGTMFVDVNYEAEGIFKTYLNLGTSTSNYIAIGARSNNKIGMEVLNSGVQVNAASTDTYSTSQRLKIAMTYKLNDFKLYVNGILQATDTSGTVPTKAEVYLGSYGNGTNQATDGINSAVLWKTALTDTELAQLTTI